MTFGTFIAVLIGGIGLGVGGLYLLSRPKNRRAGRPRARPKPKKRRVTPWMTRHQLEVLEKISVPGRTGIRLWFTDLSLATIRSLAKRGFVDTAQNGRIVITRTGRRRLNQPWPAQQPTGDQKGNHASDDVGETESVDSGASEEASPLTGGGL